MRIGRLRSVKANLVPEKGRKGPLAVARLKILAGKGRVAGIDPAGGHRRFHIEPLAVAAAVGDQQRRSHG